MRLAMNLLIKNEADIIEDNIRFHAGQGVDCFVVMDNGSEDGTRDIVSQLSQEFDIHLIERPELDYQQSNWKTEMAKTSRSVLGADWSIANDADEFWVAADGNLKHDISRWGSIVHCKRINMIPDESFHSAGFHYLDSPYRVNLPILNKGCNLVDNSNLSIMLGNINGKVMVNNHGLLRVKGGNHRAWHLWGQLNQKESENTMVFHFPIRSKESFIRNVENRARLLENGVHKMGDHYRRWVKLYRDNRLEEELERLTLSANDAQTLTKFGVIMKDTSVGSHIRSQLGCH
ncbi:MAG: hypothetical protein CMI03_16670 [Oceanospirillaceae bacterium]|uniref:glycosyltransferase family 2 protein n=1 Tax=unclassified Thalassolituus TaxID=2624967 RepID=UPI000C3934C4|nr:MULTISPECIES: glycosyltransferase family 2 protein [unclassified Thalassolituus]MBL33297.1 hypothetical protein [Oceanospirillaceae bacterium]MBS54375.1 hypothetical protein [Oceanospirillaceae bacterium]|tara:strand:- start:9297 stop:10163 length:867 start_codon:yes stop_codon:yes gene_type:complete